MVMAKLSQMGNFSLAKSDVMWPMAQMATGNASIICTSIIKWSEKWQMLLNFGKCKCLHTGHWNLDVNCKMGDTVLGTIINKKDSTVTVSADMKVSEQCGIAASKGNQICGLIRRNITYCTRKKANHISV